MKASELLKLAETGELKELGERLHAAGVTQPAEKIILDLLDHAAYEEERAINNACAHELEIKDLADICAQMQSALLEAVAWRKSALESARVMGLRDEVLRAMKADIDKANAALERFSGWLEETMTKDKFDLPNDVRSRAVRLTAAGVRIKVTPEEIVERMDEADKALNGDSNDAEHDVLYSLREWLSGIFEDPGRR